MWVEGEECVAREPVEVGPAKRQCTPWVDGASRDDVTIVILSLNLLVRLVAIIACVGIFFSRITDLGCTPEICA